jgi:hypothetical protein
MQWQYNNGLIAGKGAVVVNLRGLLCKEFPYYIVQLLRVTWHHGDLVFLIRQAWGLEIFCNKSNDLLQSSSFNSC